MVWGILGGWGCRVEVFIVSWVVEFLGDFLKYWQPELTAIFFYFITVC